MTTRRKSLTAGKLSAAVGSIAAAVMLMAAPAAHADLIQAPSIQVQGSGLGAVNTLVTIQDARGIESGCVSSTGGATFSTMCMNGLIGGDEKLGNSQTKTQLVSGLSASPFTAGNLALVVNVVEPGNDLAATLTDLYLSLYSASGTQVGNFQYTGPDVVLTQSTAAGTGGSGFVFVLDAAQAAQANAACPVLTNCYAGGGFQFASGTTAGGSETLYITVVRDGVVQPPQEIPEPGALALFGVAGVLGALAARRRRNLSA